MPACSKCRSPIMWRKTPAGKSAPLDVDPSPRGNTVLVDGGGCRVLSKDELTAARDAGTSLYTNHFATCRFAASFRKPKE